MGTVLCAKDYPVDLPSGRSLGPGETATDVDLDDTLVRTNVEAGALVVLEDPKPAKAEQDLPDEPAGERHATRSKR